MKNNAMFMTGLNQMEMREVPVPLVRADQVLVKMEYVGIGCSDIHYLEYGRMGDSVINQDFILGHECAGAIVEVGSAVESLKVGDKVVLEPSITCGRCEFCKGGKYNLCPNVEFLATPPYHGCLEEYIVFPANMCFKLPANITTKEGALVEPLAVGIHAASQGNVGIGDSVVILGAGCIGLVTLLACIARGATDIIVVDMKQKSLEYALELGATSIINAAEGDVLEAISGITGKKGVDVVVETAGNKQTIKQTADIIKRGGTIVLVGLAPENIIDYDFAQIMNKEASIKSVFRYRNNYIKAINAIAQGNIDVSGIVTHEYEFADTAAAFDFVIHNKNDVVKAMIKF